MIKSIKNEPTSSTNENSCDISYVMLGIFGLFLFKCSSYILQTPWNNIYQNVNKIEEKKIIIPGPNLESLIQNKSIMRYIKLQVNWDTEFISEVKFYFGAFWPAR